MTISRVVEEEYFEGFKHLACPPLITPLASSVIIAVRLFSLLNITKSSCMSSMSYHYQFYFLVSYSTEDSLSHSILPFFFSTIMCCSHFHILTPIFHIFIPIFLRVCVIPQTLKLKLDCYFQRILIRVT